MKITFLLLIEIVILLEVFLVSFMFEPFLIFIFITWLLLIKVFHLKFYSSIIYGLVNLFLCPFLLVLNLDLQAENLANFAYFFLLIGVTQSLFFDRIDVSRKIND